MKLLELFRAERCSLRMKKPPKKFAMLFCCFTDRADNYAILRWLRALIQPVVHEDKSIFISPNRPLNSLRSTESFERHLPNSGKSPWLILRARHGQGSEALPGLIAGFRKPYRRGILTVRMDFKDGWCRSEGHLQWLRKRLVLLFSRIESIERTPDTVISMG